MRRLSLIVVLALSAAIGLIGCGVTPTSGEGIFNSPVGIAINWPYAYITNGNFGLSADKHGFITTVDLRVALTRGDLAVVARLKTDPFLGKIVLSKDGKTAYVTDRRTNTVLLFDLTDPEHPQPIIVDPNAPTIGIGVALQPYGLTLSPDGSRLFVACEQSGHVSIVDLNKRILLTSTTLANGVNEVKFDPQGKYVYVTNLRINAVSILDGASGNFLTSFGVNTARTLTGYDYRGLDFSPDGTRLYVASSHPAGLLIVDATKLPLNGDQAVIRTAPMDGAPMGVAVRPDGREVWVTNFDSGSVIAVDPETGTPLVSLPANHGVADIRFFARPERPDYYYALAVNFKAHDLTVYDAMTKDQIWGIP